MATAGPASTPPPMCDRAKELATAAVDHACHYLAGGEPFLGIAIGEGRHDELVPDLLQPPGAHPPERGAFMVLSAAGPDPLREHVAKRLEALDAYALLWDGYVRDSVNGKRRDAVFVEVAVRSEPCAHVVASVYRPKRLFRPFRLTGEHLLISAAPSLFAESGAAAAGGE